MPTSLRRGAPRVRRCGWHVRLSRLERLPARPRPASAVWDLDAPRASGGTQMRAFAALGAPTFLTKRRVSVDSRRCTLDIQRAASPSSSSPSSPFILRYFVTSYTMQDTGNLHDGPRAPGVLSWVVSCTQQGGAPGGRWKGLAPARGGRTLAGGPNSRSGPAVGRSDLFWWTLPLAHPRGCVKGALEVHNVHHVRSCVCRTTRWIRWIRWNTLWVASDAPKCSDSTPGTLPSGCHCVAAAAGRRPYHPMAGTRCRSEYL